MTSRLLTLFTTATVALAGCGGGTDENEVSAWSGARDCLVESGVRSFDEIPPTGPYMPPEVMPVNFTEAPGGWLIAHLNGDQELAVFFYGSAAQAERAKDEALPFVMRRFPSGLRFPPAQPTDDGVQELGRAAAVVEGRGPARRASA
jgi:hypothetical protein